MYNSLMHDAGCVWPKMYINSWKWIGILYILVPIHLRSPKRLNSIAEESGIHFWCTVFRILKLVCTHCANVKITFQMFIISDFRQNSLPWLAWDCWSHLNQRKSPNHHLYKIDLGLDQRSEPEFCPFLSILGLDDLPKLVNFWVSLSFRSTL